MGIRKMNFVIRNVRKEMGLSQEDMSDGVCSTKVLSKYERGICNPSSSMFSALMQKANKKIELIPSYKNGNDFLCYYSMQLARFHLDNHDPYSAISELEKIATIDCPLDKQFYQEWLFLVCRLRMLFNQPDYQSIYDDLLTSIKLTRADFNYTSFFEKSLLLNKLEVEIMIGILEELLFLEKMNAFLSLYTNLYNYLANYSFSSAEDSKLMISLQLIYLRNLIYSSNFAEASSKSRSLKKVALKDSNAATIVEISLYMGISDFKVGNIEEAQKTLQACIYASSCIDVSLFRSCHDFIVSTDIPIDSFELPKIDSSKEKYEAYLSKILCSPQIDFLEKTEEAFTLGNLIRQERVKQSLSIEKLSHGLCSKSTLSKIENKTLTPSIGLTECLLQRLGISEKIFTFFVSENDFFLKDSIYFLRHPEMLTSDELENILKNLSTCSNPNNKLAMQYTLFIKALFFNSKERRKDLLLEALSITFPELDFKHLEKYRLTWCELSILNNIALETCASNLEEGSILYKKMIEYMKSTPLDSIIKASIFAITLSGFCRSLYLKGSIFELLTLHESNELSFMKNIPSSYSNALFFISQAKANINRLDEARVLAQYSVSMAYLIEYYDNAKILTETLNSDYSITL